MIHWVKDVELKGKVVFLTPLSLKHCDGLSIAAANGNLWNLWYTSVPRPEDTTEYVHKALLAKKDNGEMPFVIQCAKTGKIICSTRYCHVDNHNKRLEIGYTWYSKSVQRSGANTEAKFLLLKYAFENLEAIAVEFRTHWFNQVSRKAIERLGAKQDGVLRNHQQLADGSYRDTVVYSIINLEWQSVKNHLQSKMRL